MSLHPAPAPTPEEVLAVSSRPLPKSLTTASIVLAIIGIVVFIIGLFVDADRVWRAYHFNWLFFAGLSSAGATFVGVQRITTARWSRSVIRFMEGYVAFMPVAFVLLLITIFLGAGHVFPWMWEPYPAHEKAIYYGRAFLSIRDIVIYGLMTWLSLWLIYRSVRLDVAVAPEAGADWARGIRERMRRSWSGDQRREIHRTHSIQGKIAVWMVILYGFGWSVLAWDLSMGLSLHFQSTLYGWWWFMGAWLSALMLFALLTLWWRRYLDAYQLIGEKHFHDIGKLCFAFTAFWGYLTFGQYLIIWYGNVGEETFWFHARLITPWVGFALVALFFAFVFPFFGLISKAAKMFKPTLVLFTILGFIGVWMVRYLEVYPSLYGIPEHMPFGIWEIGVTLGYIGLWAFCYLAFMNAFPRMRVTFMTSPYRDEVQVPVNPETMEPLPAHE